MNVVSTAICETLLFNFSIIKRRRIRFFIKDSVRIFAKIFLQSKMQLLPQNTLKFKIVV